MAMPRPIWNLEGALFVEQGSKLVPFPSQPSEREPEPVSLERDLGTPESIAAAKAYRDAERRKVAEITGCPVHDDGRIGLALANFMAAAVYGPRGENR